MCTYCSENAQNLAVAHGQGIFNESMSSLGNMSISFFMVTSFLGGCVLPAYILNLFMSVNMHAYCVCVYLYAYVFRHF